MRLRWIIRFAAVFAILGLFVVGTSANAEGRAVTAKLTGFEENTPKLTSGVGRFEATVQGSTLSYTLSYSGLSSDAFMAHLHFGQRAVNGGIFLWLCGSATAPGPAGTRTAATPPAPRARSACER